jgi:hypothetical protein
MINYFSISIEEYGTYFELIHNVEMLGLNKKEYFAIMFLTIIS